MGALDDRPHVEIDDRASWRAWLAEHHATSSGVWVVSRRGAAPGPKLAYEAAVEEALCFGWIDGQAAPVDAGRSKQYFAPRKQGSPWAMSNKARVERLLAEGQMAPAGLAVIDRAKVDGSWTVFDSPARLEEPAELRAALDDPDRPAARGKLERVLGVCAANVARMDRAGETRRDTPGADRARRRRRATERADPERRLPLMRRVASALSLALLLLTTVAGPASAVDWDGERKLSSTETAGHELLRTGPNSALAVWRRGGTVLARRTTDGGQTWLPVRTIVPNAGDADVAGVGSRVDVAYVVRSTCPSTGDRALRIYYRRSLDGGVTWSAPVALTSACSRVYQPAVARSADGQVSVAWVGEFTGRIFVRTSRDGGTTFGPAVQAASTTVLEGDSIPGASRIYFADPSLAIGTSGTTYLAYTSARETLSIRRSTNRGATWSSPTRLSTSTIGLSSLVASGARAVVGYDVQPFRSVYRTTSDRGATWSSQRSIYSIDRRRVQHECPVRGRRRDLGGHLQVRHAGRRRRSGIERARTGAQRSGRRGA